MGTAFGAATRNLIADCMGERHFADLVLACQSIDRSVSVTISDRRITEGAST